MITGFNTDVKHNAKVYHVQTEDKGRGNPKIESLVYTGGEILDSFRTTYDNDGNLTEEKIMELMESQHKRVIRTIKMGKYDQPEDFPPDVVSTRTLDQVISDYLAQAATSDALKLELADQLELKIGQPMQFKVSTKKAISGTPIEGAFIRVKLICTMRQPVILCQGQTDAKGLFLAQIQIPTDQGENGDSAVVIQASHDTGVAEMKHPLR